MLSCIELPLGLFLYLLQNVGLNLKIYMQQYMLLLLIVHLII